MSYNTDNEAILVENKNLLNKTADTIRILSAAMVEKAKSGHPGGAMGGADFVSVLFAEYLNYNPNDGNWMFRDRFFLDPGHMSPMLYSVLALANFFSIDELKQFRQWGSSTPGHPEKDFKRGIENTSGPLGQGHAMAVGVAIAERFLTARFGDVVSHKTYTYISDGGIQEEISQGAGRIAGHLGLSNLIMFYDSNDIQLSSETIEVTSEDTAIKYKAWGWNVVEINGNDTEEIHAALKNAHAEMRRPTLIIGKTIIGKGVVDDAGNPFERTTSVHGMPLSNAGASFSKTIENLGGKADDPFYVSKDVLEYWNQVKQEKLHFVSEKEYESKNWQNEHPELDQKLTSFYSQNNIKVNLSEVKQKPDIATRAASGNVLSYLADKVENLIVTSADLSDSDKTDAFLKKTRAFKKNDFTGNFLQSGVSELTMAALCNGMALHGGVVAACATFFVFSDYMKPAVRMSALMELPVKYIWTHDSFRVGEDGPTHQPIEHEAQIRLMEKLQNHSGNNSMLVLRPADADETTIAWEMILDNTSTPSALILSRQGIKSLPCKLQEQRYENAQMAKYGGYAVYGAPDESLLILVGNGSEVSTLIDSAHIIESKLKIPVSVVSIISEGLFRQQNKEYQLAILPENKLKVGLCAGLADSLQGLVGANGHVISFEKFGYSAPAGVLNEKLGFTAEAIYEIVKKLME